MDQQVNACVEWKDQDQISIGTAYGQELRSLPFQVLLLLFLWKLEHDLLTTEVRINATLGNISATCRFGCGVVADLEHCFFRCCLTDNVGNWLLNLIRKFEPINEDKILKISLLNEALIWTVAMTLHFIWSRRAASKIAELHLCVALLKAEVEIMKDTKFNGLADEITKVIS